MKPLHSNSLRLLLSLILAMLPMLFAKADNCCPDANQNCHMINMAMSCTQCLPTAITSAEVVPLATPAADHPEALQQAYIHPPADPIWRPPTSHAEY